MKHNKNKKKLIELKGKKQSSNIKVIISNTKRASFLNKGPLTTDKKERKYRHMFIIPFPFVQIFYYTEGR